MKHILFLLSRFLDGGIDRVLLDYLRNLSQRNDYRITLSISTGMGALEVFLREVPQSVEVVHLVEDGWLTHWRKQKVVGQLPMAAKICDELFLAPIRRSMISRKLKSMTRNYDVVVDFDCCHYSFLKNVKTWKVGWWHFSFENRMKIDHQRMRHIGKRLTVYDRVVVISKAMLEEGRRLFPQMEGRWRLIYNAKDQKHLQQLAAEPVSDERINQPYILAVERLEESQKDIANLIRAFKLLKSQYQHEERLYILGQGRSEDDLRQLAADLGLGDEVVFLGFRQNPYPWIRQTRLLVHSAKSEGLPTVLVEGIMLDKIIVATDCPTGPNEILNGGEAGVLVPVGNPQALAEGMHSALSDDDLRNRLLERLRTHRWHFTFETTQRLFFQAVN